MPCVNCDMKNTTQFKYIMCNWCAKNNMFCSKCVAVVLFTCKVPFQAILPYMHKRNWKTDFSSRLTLNKRNLTHFLFVSNSTKDAAQCLWWVWISQLAWLDIVYPVMRLLHTDTLRNRCWDNILCVCVCVWRGCIITILCVVNNAGGAAGAQLAYQDLSINISQQSGYWKGVFVNVCVCLAGCVFVVVVSYCGAQCLLTWQIITISG